MSLAIETLAAELREAEWRAGEGYGEAGDRIEILRAELDREIRREPDEEEESE